MKTSNFRMYFCNEEVETIHTCLERILVKFQVQPRTDIYNVYKKKREKVAKHVCKLVLHPRIACKFKLICPCEQESTLPRSDKAFSLSII